MIPNIDMWFLETVGLAFENIALCLVYHENVSCRMARDTSCSS